MRLILSVFAAGLLTLLAACGGSITVAGVTLTPTDQQCLVGEATKQVAGVQPPVTEMTKAQLAVFVTTAAEQISAPDRCNIDIAAVRPYLQNAVLIAKALDKS